VLLRSARELEVDVWIRIDLDLGERRRGISAAANRVLRAAARRKSHQADDERS
jgi:hypothetical protein